MAKNLGGEEKITSYSRRVQRKDDIPFKEGDSLRSQKDLYASVRITQVGFRDRLANKSHYVRDAREKLWYQLKDRLVFIAQLREEIRTRCSEKRSHHL